MARSQTFYTLRGYVLSSTNEPLPNASIRVFNLQTGTQANENGQYELVLEQGLHRISVSYLGFLTQTLEVVIDQDKAQNFILESDDKLLSEVIINAKKKDYSYEVIKNVIENKEQWQNQYSNLFSKTYVKATEEIKQAKKADKDENSNPFLADTLPNLNYFEAQIDRYLGPSGKQKEERNGIKKYGDLSTLFYTSSTDAGFDLYENLQSFNKLGENALVSPFSTIGFISYKFKLLETYHNGERLVYRIEVKPKNIGNALYEGEVEVLDGLWAIHKVSLRLSKKLLIIYDQFSLTQEYDLIDNKRVISKESFHWRVKEGTEFRIGESVVTHSDFKFDSLYAKNFFGPEIGNTTALAYKRDSSYWESIRPAPLNPTERAVVKANELQELRLNSKEYLDSIDAVYNKVTFMKVLWSGVGQINRSKKINWEFGSLPSLLNPVAIGGWRVQYRLQVYKRFEDRRALTITPYLNYGFLNRDLRGQLTLEYLYNAKKQSKLFFNAGQGFDVINGSATISDVFRRNNFYINTGINLGHRTELFNGFYFNTDVQYNNRKDFGDFRFSRLGDELFKENVPAFFPTTNILKTNFRIDYTPRQLYLSEPNEKIVLGSKFPTFSLRLNKGFQVENGLNNGFTYTELNISQYFNVGILGTSEYRIGVGRFLDTTSLAPMDYQYQRGGDPIWFSPSMYTYQLIPQTFSTTGWFFESHYEHQFNGFLTSKVPLLNKTGINTLAGGGFLYVPEQKYQYSELYTGANSVFKLGKSRFRIGAYYVVSQSNKDGFKSGFKFSFEPYNRDKNTWSF